MKDSLFERVFLQVLLFLVIVFMLAPILIVVVNSFNSSAFSAWPPQGFTLEWYNRVLSNPAFQRGAYNSLIIGVSSTVVVIAVGMPIAYAMARFRIKGIAALKAVLFAPLIIPRVAIGFAMFALCITIGHGLYGSLLAIILAHAVLMLPFVVTIMLASFGEVDPIVEEAARDLGASPMQAFRLATLPQVSGALVVAAVFSFITSFDEVETTLFLAKPESTTLPVEMYHFLEQYQDPTIAALSTLLIAFTVLILMIVPFVMRGGALMKLMGKGRH